MPETTPPPRDAIIVGGGLAGLSAAIYLGRAMRDTLVLDAGRSMAGWEPHVENFLGFPEGISGESLLERGRVQAARYGVEVVRDEILAVERGAAGFVLRSEGATYLARRLLLATGLYHIPPDIPGVPECLGQSLFFCKDCDGYRVQGKRVAIIGCNDDTVEYALGMLAYSPRVVIATNRQAGFWSPRHAAWLEEYDVPVVHGRIRALEHEGGRIRALRLEDGQALAAETVFSTRGDLYFNRLAKSLGAEVDAEGQVVVDARLQTTVPGLYAAGCLTPANCQMIIAAGQGAIAAQAINRDLFEESLETHALRRCRALQLSTEQTEPFWVGEEEA